MSGPLSTFGVGADAERLYRHVLRAAPATLEQHAAALGLPGEQAAPALRALLVVRLVREGVDRALVAEPPRASIERLVDREHARLDLRRRELEEARAAIHDFAAEHIAGQAEALTTPAVDVVPPEHVVNAIEDLVRSTTGTMRSAHVDVARGASADSDLGRLVRSQLLGGRELRSVYPSGVLDDDERRTFVADWGEAGERQRLVPLVPHEFAVLGEDAVVSSTRWGGPSAPLLVVRMPVLVQAFAQVFDDLWDTGLPVPTGAQADDEDGRLLSLLAAGFKDEAIARYLGLGVRTVRRRVAALMDSVGASTRFQLGVAAQRRGLVGRGRR